MYENFLYVPVAEAYLLVNISQKLRVDLFEIFSKGVMKRPPISAVPGLDRRWSFPSASYCHGRWRLRGITVITQLLS